MSWRCLFGHNCSEGRYNDGLSFGACDTCGRMLVRRSGGRWYELPQEYELTWSTTGEHAVAPGRVIQTAKRKAPFIQHLRRRPASFGGYFSDDVVGTGPKPWLRAAKDED